MKALGTRAFPRRVLARHRGLPAWRPTTVTVHDGAARRCAAMGATSSFLTITHSQDLAIAQVLLVKGPAEN